MGRIPGNENGGGCLKTKTLSLIAKDIEDTPAAIRLETDHGKCQRIGQYVLSVHSDKVQTYFACHEFRRGHLAIYLKGDK